MRTFSKFLTDNFDLNIKVFKLVLLLPNNVVKHALRDFEDF